MKYCVCSVNNKNINLLLKVASGKTFGSPLVDETQNIITDN